MFRGIRGNGFAGDIGLDDLSMTSSQVCGTAPSEADPTKTTTTQMPTTTTVVTAAPRKLSENRYLYATLQSVVTHLCFV